MRLEREEIKVTKSANFEEGSFSIKASPEAFDILSSKLSSDPFLAIIRELSTNAWDAHTEANKKHIPFEVHLPNRLEPFFKIRDFGTGLSHQDVMKLYTTYFESTKRESNSQVGAWGLGSKSPYSYTDNFSVTSWFNGKKRTYSMFKGQTGPRVALLNTIDSDEPYGLEVQFACKVEDINLFLQKAEFVYQKFPVTPIFQGESRARIQKENPLLKGENWKLYKGAGYSYAIMGCIGYPIHGHQLPSSIQMPFRGRVDIEIPIGSLDIAVSREQLQYTDKTKETLVQILKNLKDSIGKEVSEKVSSLSSIWEARIYCKKLSYVLDGSHSRDGWIRNNITWHGKIVPLGMPNIQEVGTATKYFLVEQKNGPVVRRQEETYIDRLNNVQFFINDVDFKPGERISSWLKYGNSGAEVVYLVELTEWTKEKEDKLHELLGTNPSFFKTVSSLPKPIRKKRAKTISQGPASPRIPIYARGFTFREELKSYYQGEEKYAWESAIIDVANPGIYVSWKRNFVENMYLRTPESLAKTLHHLDKIGLKPDKLYAIKAGYVDKVLEIEPKWKDFSTYIKECLEEYIKVNNLEETIKLAEGSRHVRNLCYYAQIASYIDDSSPLKDFIERIQGKENEREIIKSLQEIANKVGYALPWQSVEIEALEIKERYPMLKWIDKKYYGYGVEELRDAAEYVKLVDRKEKECQTE